MEIVETFVDKENGLTYKILDNDLVVLPKKIRNDVIHWIVKKLGNPTIYQIRKRMHEMGFLESDYKTIKKVI